MAGVQTDSPCEPKGTDRACVCHTHTLPAVETKVEGHPAYRAVTTTHPPTHPYTHTHTHTHTTSYCIFMTPTAYTKLNETHQSEPSCSTPAGIRGIPTPRHGNGGFTAGRERKVKRRKGEKHVR